MLGKLNLVSIGPGFVELIPPLAKQALQESKAIVGYGLYLKWIMPWIKEKEIFTFPITQEKERAAKAIDLARQDRAVSLVSSGDIGIYAMATLVFEMMEEKDRFDLQVIPGISAANSCASLLGAPLSHDFAILSLSDLLCPWEQIRQRARKLAEADLVVALYNVQSRERQKGVYEILRIFLEHKKPETWCGIVRNAYRDEESVKISTLSELLKCPFDMVTTLVIGNRFTKKKRNFIYTPRGYFPLEKNTSLNHSGALPNPSIWVFSGTSDGNALAHEIAKDGYPVIVSAATEYGKEMVTQNIPSLTVRAGHMGAEARYQELQESGALAIVDATHPFATEISLQLMDLAKKLEIPYVRYERPSPTKRPSTIYCKTMEKAAEEAVRLGKRIFLATGTKDLSTFLKASRAKDRQWFVRIIPNTTSLERVLSFGIPRTHICSMQGPFSKEFNEALWRNWSIDCVVTKESGEAGGFEGKASAAESLKIPLVVVERPKIEYPICMNDFSPIINYLTTLKNSVSPSLSPTAT